MTEDQVRSVRFRYRCGDDWFRVIFPYDEPMIRAVKDLLTPHRHWNEEERCWFVKNGYAYLDLLAKTALVYFKIVQAEVVQQNGEVEITNMRTGEVMVQGDLFAQAGDSG